MPLTAVNAMVLVMVEGFGSIIRCEVVTVVQIR